MPIDRDQYRQTCRHFNGVQNTTCKAGVRYGDFANRDLLAPCLPRMGPREVGTCDKREPYTEADIDAREAQIEASMERHRKAGPVIAEIRKAHKGRSATGSVPCPACGTGTLHWAIAGYNGHMRGRCSAAGCLNWME
jgi:hypothetical protein